MTVSEPVFDLHQDLRDKVCQLPGINWQWHPDRRIVDPDNELKVKELICQSGYNSLYEPIGFAMPFNKMFVPDWCAYNDDLSEIFFVEVTRSRGRTKKPHRIACVARYYGHPVALVDGNHLPYIDQGSLSRTIERAVRRTRTLQSLAA